MIKKVKNTVPWTYVIRDVNGAGIVRKFYEKELQKPNQKKFRVEEVIKWKDYKLKYNDYDNFSEVKKT